MSGITDKENFQPVTSSNFPQSYGRWIVVLEFWIVTSGIIFINLWYFKLAIEGPWYWWLLLPLNLLGNLYLFSMLTAILSWIILQILRKIEPPKEGMFPIDSREFRFYCRRFWTLYYPLYLFRSMPLPWSDMVPFRMFGVKVGQSVVLYDGWVDHEYVEIGGSVMLSLNSQLLSHCVYKDHFYVKKISVGKNAIVGAQTVAAPGTVVEDGAIVGANASTKIDQHLDAYLTHVGSPISKSLPIRIKDKSKDASEPKKDTKQDENLTTTEKKTTKDETVGGEDPEMSAPTSLKLAPPCPVDPRIRRAHLLSYLIQTWISVLPAAFLAYFCMAPITFAYSLQGWLSTWFTIPEWLLILLVPPILISIYIVTVIWTAIITKIRLGWLILLHKPIEGLFNRDVKDKDYVYWNKRNMARLFLNWLLYTPPLPFMKRIFAYRIFGSKLGKKGVFWDCWLSQEFVEVGNNVLIGQGVGIYSFMFDVGKLLVAKIIIEDNVILGARSVILPGAIIHKNTIVSASSYSLPFQELTQILSILEHPSNLFENARKGNYKALFLYAKKV